MRTNSYLLGTLAASALLLAAVSANAQDSRYDYDNAAYQADENVDIAAPPYGPQRSREGAPYVLTSLSQPVYFDDLNLRTSRGAHILRTRVRLTARLLCRDLDERYPVTADNSPPCYRNAVSDALYQADRAIADARSSRDYR